MTITRNRDGSYTVSAIVAGYYEHRTYYGYSRRDCVRMFRAEFKGRIGR